MNVLELQAHFQVETMICLVFPLMRQDLGHILKRGGCFSTAKGLDCVGQVFSGLSFLHEQRVAHRDIKPENVLSDDDGGYKIADYDLSIVLSPNFECADMVGTLEYMAPEALVLEAGRPVPHNPCLADVWSAGVTFYQLTYGFTPFASGDRHQTAHNILGCTFATHDLDERASQLMSNCIVQVSGRLSASRAAALCHRMVEGPFPSPSPDPAPNSNHIWLTAAAASAAALGLGAAVLAFPALGGLAVACKLSAVPWPALAAVYLAGEV
jgi:serine/threonine protein kinase